MLRILGKLHKKLTRFRYNLPCKWPFAGLFVAEWASLAILSPCLHGAGRESMIGVPDIRGEQTTMDDNDQTQLRPINSSDGSTRSRARRKKPADQPAPDQSPAFTTNGLVEQAGAAQLSHIASAVGEAAISPESASASASGTAAPADSLRGPRERYTGDRSDQAI